jgi:hypothetical protein
VLALFSVWVGWVCVGWASTNSERQKSSACTNGLPSVWGFFISFFLDGREKEVVDGRNEKEMEGNGLMCG